jgi:hypothetical protein
MGPTPSTSLLALLTLSWFIDGVKYLVSDKSVARLMI